MIQKIELQPRAKKIIKDIFGGLWWLTLIVLALVMFSIIGAKMRGKTPQIFGYSVMHIVTGSMGETIPEGSYILVEVVDPEQIKKDDIICFYSSDPAIYGMPNTHRVVEDPIYTENGIEFVTKGDANKVKDKYTAQSDRVIGRYVRSMDKLNAFVVLLDKGGMTVLIFVIEAIIMAMAVGNFLRAKKQAAQEAAENKDLREHTFTQEEIERMLGENPDIVKEIEEKLGLSSPLENNEKAGEEE